MATIQVKILCVVQTISCVTVFVPTSKIPIERRDKFKCFNVGLAWRTIVHTIIIIIIKLMTTDKQKKKKKKREKQHTLSSTKYQTPSERNNWRPANAISTFTTVIYIKCMLLLCKFELKRKTHTDTNTWRWRWGRLCDPLLALQQRQTDEYLGYA